MTRDDVIRSTAAHIRRVGELMVECAGDLSLRAVSHDASKWSPEEWPAFEASTPRLAGVTYGSEEYKECLRAIRPAIDHHQKHNSHHPEFFPDGIDGMTLLDLVEMLCDWKAATERHNDGDITKSLAHNRERFKIGEQLLGILENTAVSHGWMQRTPKLAVGAAVTINSMEGFGGPAKVVETRQCNTNRYKVLMDDGSQPAFWAHDFEVGPPTPAAAV